MFLALLLAVWLPSRCEAQSGLASGTNVSLPVVTVLPGSSTSTAVYTADSPLLVLGSGFTLNFGTCNVPTGALLSSPSTPSTPSGGGNGSNSNSTVAPAAISTGLSLPACSGPLTVTLYTQQFTVIPVTNVATSPPCPSSCGFTASYFNTMSANLSVFVRLTCQTNAMCNATLAYNVVLAAPPPSPPPPPPSPAPPSPPLPPPPSPPLAPFACAPFRFPGPGAGLFQICSVYVFAGVATSLTTCPTALSGVPTATCTGQTALTVYTTMADAIAATPLRSIAYGDSSFNLNQNCGGCAELSSLGSTIDTLWNNSGSPGFNTTWYVRQECASFSTAACSGTLGFQYSFSPPPPSPPPPSPPPPSPPPTAIAVLNAAIATVNFNLSLSGFTVANFGFTPAAGGAPIVTGPALIVLNALAAQLNVPSYVVSYASLLQLGATPSGRHLLQTGALQATMSLAALDASSLSTYTTAMTTLSSSPATFFGALSASLTSGGYAGVQFMISPPQVVNNAVNKIQNIQTLCTTNAAQCTGSTQYAFLTQVQTSTTLINLTAATVNNVATTMAAVTSAGTLDPASQQVALAVLGNISSQGSLVQADAAQAITQSLSNVAASGASSSVSTVLSGVLDSLTVSASKSLTPNSPPLQLSSPTINSTVAVSNGSLPDASHFNTPSCGVSALPANALNSNNTGGSSVTTQFNSLSFDANGGNNTNTMRLGFLGGNGSAIAVQNQVAPVVFNLPPVAPSGTRRRRLLDGDGIQQATCQFHDSVTNAYVQQGCVGVPNPAPWGHILNFVPNYKTPDDNSLLMAWEINGPLVDGCCSFLLNCSDPDMADVQYPLNPYDAVGTGKTAACSAITQVNPVTGTKALRMFTGPDCGLINETNGAQCFWNFTKQAFQGPGCVYNGPTQCMCRHLTDFASANKPAIKTASLSDLTAINPNDLITKIKDLFIMVMILWGGMNVGAFIGYGLDRDEKKKLLARLMRPECGFRLGQHGEWLWHLDHKDMDQEVEAPQGTAVALCGVFGMPFSRLRMALPEELMPGKLAHAMGRKYGLSVSRMRADKERETEALRRIAQGLKSMITCSGGRDDKAVKGDVQEVHAGNGLAAASDTPHLGPITPPVFSAGIDDLELGPDKHSERLSAEDAVGTALVYAFILNAALLSPEELSRQFQASSHVLRHVPTGNQWSFSELYDRMSVMLSAGNLNAKADWVERARLWRLFLSQNKDGSWDASATVAFSVLACQQDEAERVKNVPLRKFKFLADLAEMMEGNFFESQADFADNDDVEQFQQQQGQARELDRQATKLTQRIQTDVVFALRATAAESMRTKLREWLRVTKEAREERLAARGFLLHDDEAPDCLLSACPASICVTMPRSLRLAARGMAAHSKRRTEGEDALLAAVGGRGDEHSETGEAAVTDEPPTRRKGIMNRFFGGVGTPPKGDARRQPRSSATGRIPADLEDMDDLSGGEQQAPPASLRSQLQMMTDNLATERALAQRLQTSPPTGAGARQVEHQDALFDSDDDAPRVFRKSSTIARRSSTKLQLGASFSAPRLSSTELPEKAVVTTFKPLGMDLAERVWTTLLVLNVLQSQEEMLLFSDDADPLERTSVDAALSWLQSVAEKYPVLAPLLAENQLPAHANLVMARWRRLIAHRIAELRRSETVTDAMSIAHVQRISSNLVHKVVTKHDTFSTFLKPPLDGLSRWQMFMILVTIVMSGLLVNIWMFYSRGSSCCSEVRALLNCDPVPAPCRGFMGDCGDIPNQFTGANLMMFVDPTSSPQCVPANPLIDYYCTAFPDPENPIDSFLVGLIAIAVALPTSIFCVSAFELSNEVDSPGTWLVFRVGPIGRRLLGDLPQDWHYARDGPGTQPSRFTRWFLRFYTNGEPIIITVINLVRRLIAFITCTRPAWEEPLEEEETEANEEGDESSSAAEAAEAAEAAAEARHEAIKKRLIASAGVFGLTLAWVIFAWFVFAYGLLIYNTLGPKAEKEFTKSWGISYAMDNATQWKDIFQEAVRGIIILAILERLMLTRHSSWLDEHLDFYSVQAMLYTDKVVKFTKQIQVRICALAITGLCS